MKTYIKKIREAINSGDREASLQLLPKVFESVDRAVAKGAIHKNTGSRYKSRLSKMVQKMTAQSG